MAETVIDLGRKVKAKYPGQYDDLSDQELGQRVKAKYPDAYGDFTDVAATPIQSTFNDTRTTRQVATDQAMNVLKGVPQAITGIPAAAVGLAEAVGNPGKQWELLKSAAQPLTSLVRGAGALIAPNTIQAPSRQEFQQGAQGIGAFAGGLAAAEVAPVVGEKLGQALPKAIKASAGAKFNTIKAAVGDVPIDLTEANRVIDSALSESKLGGPNPPQVMKKFIKAQQPVTAKFGGQKIQMQAQPMTYKEGFRFASNAGDLSSTEMQGLNGVMKGKVGEFARALKEANRDAAASAGLGDLYDQAMKQYRLAKTIEEKAAIIRRWAVPAAFTALGLYHAGSLVRGLSE